jgi:hypothetical protein
MAGQAGSTGIVYPTPAWIVYDGDPYPPRPPSEDFTAFVRACNDFEDYANAIAEKFLILRTLTLEPGEWENPLRTSHTVTATLTRLGTPLVGEVIYFEVIDGPNAGKNSETGNPPVPPVTDANGQCTWTYVDDSAGPGNYVDTIRCSNSYAEHVVYSNTVGKLWVPYPDLLQLTPEGDENCLGTSHTVTALLTDAGGEPMADRIITFTVISGPNAGKTGSDTTGADGKASWTYTDDNATDGQTDTIRAEHNYNGGITSNDVTKTWVFCQTPGFPSMSVWGMLATVMALCASAIVLMVRRRLASYA